jgi:hypothetical protein
MTSAAGVPMSSTQTLESLLDGAECTYRALRILVIDRLPPGTTLDSQPLTAVQRLAVDRFNRAERSLADYRASAYQSWSAQTTADRALTPQPRLMSD